MVCVLQAISRRATGLISAALLVTAMLGWPSAMSAAQPPPGEATAVHGYRGRPLFFPVIVLVVLLRYG